MSEDDLTEKEIEAIRTAAARLPLVEPSRDLWPGIEARLGTQVIDINRNVQRRPRGIAASTRMLAMAASVLIMATAGTTYIVLRDRVPDNGGTVASGAARGGSQQEEVVPASLGGVGGEFGAYTEEIDNLQGAIAERRAKLDPATIAVIEKNLRIIDGAIEESKQALAKDPASPFLTALLGDALADKIRLLRQAAMLPPLT